MKNNYLHELKKYADKDYALFQLKITPTLDKKSILGVRIPVLRKLAKDIYKEGNYQEYLNELPHKYYDENNLHAFIINNFNDYDETITALNMFLPYLNNWATCDGLNPKAFKNNKDKLLKDIKSWLKSNNPFIVRFAILMLMKYYLDNNYHGDYLKIVSNIKNNNYYVKMMQAWFFAEALIKHYDDAIKYLEDEKLGKWIHNKTIQKAVDSYRLSEEKKKYLKNLRK